VKILSRRKLFREKKIAWNRILMGDSEGEGISGREVQERSAESWGKGFEFILKEEGAERKVSHSKVRS